MSLSRGVLLILLGLVELCAVLAEKGSFNLVSSDGSIQGANRVTNFLTSQVGTTEAQVVGVLDCSDKGCSVVNDIFGTGLDASKDGGINLGVVEGKAVLYGSFEEMFSSKFCGSKAADYLTKVCDTVCILLPGGEEALDAFVNYEQAVRRVIARAGENAGERISLILVIDGEENEERDALLTSKVASIFAETVESSSFSSLNDLLDLTVTSSGKDVADCLSEVSQTVSDMPDQLIKRWVDVSSGTPKAILTASERESLFAVEDAYSAGIAQSEAVMNQWRSRVSNGKVVENFGKRAEALVDGIKKSFFARTLGCRVVRERADRVSLLTMNIRNTAENLLKQQVTILQASAVAAFKKALVKVMHNGGGNEEDENTLRVASYEFRAKVGALESEALGLDASAAISELASSLQMALKDFPESNQARLESIRLMDRKAKKPKKKKGRAVNIGLNLVGMLRPPGYGNLQGFAGYATSAFGLPLDLLLGVQNDGDSPEVMGDDREYPILRLQPKIHFDIDV